MQVSQECLDEIIPGVDVIFSGSTSIWLGEDQSFNIVSVSPMDLFNASLMKERWHGLRLNGLIQGEDAKAQGHKTLVFV